jgi:hypothetical protein
MGTPDNPDRNDYLLVTARGKIQFSRFFSQELGVAAFCRVTSEPSQTLYGYRSRGMFGFAVGEAMCGQLNFWKIPWWFPTTIFGIFPVARLAFQRRKHLPGFCFACGYDLRESKDRCPECGTPIREKS